MNGKNRYAMFGYKNKQESGAVVLNGHHSYSTSQCVHCGAHENIIPGSGKKRGFCPHCQGFLCGRKKCFTCIPFEAKLEYQEALFFKNLNLIKQLTSKYPMIPILRL